MCCFSLDKSSEYGYTQLSYLALRVSACSSVKVISRSSFLSSQGIYFLSSCFTLFLAEGPWGLQEALPVTQGSSSTSCMFVLHCSCILLIVSNINEVCAPMPRKEKGNRTSGSWRCCEEQRANKTHIICQLIGWLSGVSVGHLDTCWHTQAAHSRHRHTHTGRLTKAERKISILKSHL